MPCEVVRSREPFASGCVRTFVSAFEEGEIEIDSIVPITVEQITPRLARQCGFASVNDLLKVARHGRGENVYLVEFHYIAPKSRRL